MTDGVSLVVPTLGRPSLAGLLTALDRAGRPPMPVEVLVVDDRRGGEPLRLPPVAGAVPRLLVGDGRGPAAARNLGWRAARYDWVSFLDDDVVPLPGWFDRLAEDLAVADHVGGVQGRVRVPLPANRRPTDWERVTAGLAHARWITADMAYRRRALAEVGGFDERLPRAYREDAELAYRVRRAGWELVRGTRAVVHPVRPESAWVSLRVQRGNADDALLRRRYGRRWRSRLELPPGRRARHALVTAAGVGGLLATAGAAALRRSGRSPVAARAARRVAAGAAAAWLAGTAEFAYARVRPGPWHADEVAAMAVTSVLVPPLAVGHWLRGWWTHRGVRPASR